MTSKVAATLLIARHTLQEAARQRLFGLLLALALAFAFGARWLREFDFGTAELTFIADCGFGAMALFGAALSILATTHLLLGDIGNGSLLMLLAKPVGRGSFVLGRFVGVTGLLALYCAGVAGVILAVLGWRQHEITVRLAADSVAPALAYATVVATAFLQWLRLVVLAALVLLVATFARGALFASITGVFVFIACQLQPIARARYRHDDPGFAWAMDHALAVLPNFQAFSLDQPATEWVSGLGTRVLGLTAYGLGYVVLACGLAVYSFRHREL